MVNSRVFDGMTVDHIDFYVTDLHARADAFVTGYGLSVYASSEEHGTPAHPGRAADPAAPGASAEASGTRALALGRNDIRLVLTEVVEEDHPGRAFTERHGDGVADIALRVPDAAAAYAEAVARGARPVSGPAVHEGIVRASIGGFGDVIHTFVQRPDGHDQRALPGLRPTTGTDDGATDVGLAAVDHFAVCLEAGQLLPAVDYYRTALGFREIFAERVVVGAQAMESRVVQSASGAVTLTLIEPDVSREPGQIDAFLKKHDGSGVQHIAFTARNIVESVGSMAEAGVEFLSTPATYYGLLAERLDCARHGVDELRALNILVDEDHDGQLFQIFTRSTHPRGTLFMEVIERQGARTFGSGNIKALYEAVELQRSLDEGSQ